MSHFYVYFNNDFIYKNVWAYVRWQYKMYENIKLTMVLSLKQQLIIQIQWVIYILVAWWVLASSSYRASVLYWVNEPG